ncbi:hypothetical protein [Chryseobacterium sp. SL1]|uniref:hypothetical protein n=1 Tax=Chryseobacterium sp. SL1 TaxID=2995159 RepID=UPI00227631A0|nr:hypothetical protein [Chryseobacterium sp. SL1]MCY1660794.1 hypothetical protein [Chryseobacterium sp. SL1]
MKNYSKRLLLIQLLLFIFIGCKKYQSQDHINTKFTVDKENIKDDSYSSKNLDNLFAAKGNTYFEPDYTGTSFDDYYVKNIVVKDQKGKKSNYLLFFDNKDILKDTLRIADDKMYSLNVIFDSNRKGIAVGTFDAKQSYFKIEKNFELDKNLKLKPIPVSSKIEKCPLPVQLLSEENVGLEEHFTFGTQNSDTKKESQSAQTVVDEFSQWKGNYQADFEISRTDGDYQVKYEVKITDKNNVAITEKINDESNLVSGTFINSVSDDKIVIKSKTDDTLEYIVAKIGGKYYLMGNTIYMLNPPNDKYILKKI